MYWLGLRPDDVHWNISSPWWAKQAWSCFFAPWNASAGVFIFEQARFYAKRTLDSTVRCWVTSLCAPPTACRAFALLGLAVVFFVIALTARPDLRSVGGSKLIDWLQTRQVAARKSIWSTGCKSWYLDKNGVPASWPWSRSAFFEAMARPDLESFDRVG